MSKLLSRLAGIFSSRTLVGVDRTGNKYFTRQEPVDGIMKEKRWVTFKGEDDPTTIPVEWICWLNGQRKKAPTPEEMAEMEARRERVKLNVALLKKQEEEERKSKEGSTRQSMRTGKVGGPDLKSFIQQFPAGSVEGEEHEEELMEDDTQRYRNTKETEERKQTQPRTKETPKSSEPSGSGQSFQPGTWQPPV